MLNVGKRSVERARKVTDSGDQKLIAEVERGDVSVSAAADALQPSPSYRPGSNRGLAEIQSAVKISEAFTSLFLNDDDVPKISNELKIDLKGHKAAMRSWMLQHKDDGIPAILAAHRMQSQ